MNSQCKVFCPAPCVLLTRKSSLAAVHKHSHSPRLQYNVPTLTTAWLSAPAFSHHQRCTIPLPSLMSSTLLPLKMQKRGLILKWEFNRSTLMLLVSKSLSHLTLLVPAQPVTSHLIQCYWESLCRGESLILPSAAGTQMWFPRALHKFQACGITGA